MAAQCLLMDYKTHYDSPLGGITLASDGASLTGLWFDKQKYVADESELKHVAWNDLTVFAQTKEWLDIYFGGRDPQFSPPLLMRGSAFRRQVWEVLLTIPYGHTLTYGDVARAIGCKSAQAVGGATGHNAIGLIVPCHRVIGANGSLTGYAGGIDKKEKLLQMEGVLAGMDVRTISRDA